MSSPEHRNHSYFYDEAPPCNAICSDHHWVCRLRRREHTQDSSGNLLHVCGFGRGGHHFYEAVTS